MLIDEPYKESHKMWMESGAEGSYQPRFVQDLFGSRGSSTFHSQQSPHSSLADSQDNLVFHPIIPENCDSSVADADKSPTFPGTPQRCDLSVADSAESPTFPGTFPQSPDLFVESDAGGDGGKPQRELSSYDDSDEDPTFGLPKKSSDESTNEGSTSDSQQEKGKRKRVADDPSTKRKIRKSTDSSGQPGKRKSQDSTPPEKKKRKTSPRTRKQTSGEPRKKHKCPIEKCGASVVYLQRHLKYVHPTVPMWQYPTLMDKKDIPIRKYITKKCPMPGCQWQGTRPDMHLKSAHKLPRDVACAKGKLAEVAPDEVPQDAAQATELTPQIVADKFALWYQSFEGGKPVGQEAASPVKTLHGREIVKLRTRTKKIISLACGDKFVPARLSLLRFFGRTEEEGGILEKLKRELECKWGTVKNYVLVVGHLIRFLCVTTDFTRGWWTAEQQGAMEAAYKGVLKSVSKKTTEEGHQKQMDNPEEPIPMIFTVAYLDSTVVKRMLQSLGALTEASIIGKEFYTECRDNLMLMLCITNGKRSGVFSFLTLKRVQKTPKKKDDMCQIIVKEHKTLRSAGASVITIDPPMYAALVKFAQYVRPAIVGNSPYMFVTHGGSWMDSSAINKALQKAWAAWQKEDDVQAPQLTATKVRKSIITVSREKGHLSGEQLKELARQMDHTYETANKHYNLGNGLVISRRAARMIMSMMRQSAPDARDDDVDPPPAPDVQDEGYVDIEPVVMEEPDEATPQAPAPSTGHPPTPQATAPSTGHPPSPQAPAPSTGHPPRPPAPSRQVLFGKERVFNDEERSMIAVAYKQFIDEKVDNDNAPLNQVNKTSSL